MTRNFQISWSDLTSDRQEEIIESLIESLMDGYSSEGDKFLSREEYTHKQTTWEEAFCREYSLDSDIWNEPNMDWELTVEEHARNEAEKFAKQAFKYVEAEIELI